MPLAFPPNHKILLPFGKAAPEPFCYFPNFKSIFSLFPSRKTLHKTCKSLKEKFHLEQVLPMKHVQIVSKFCLTSKWKLGEHFVFLWHFQGWKCYVITGHYGQMVEECLSWTLLWLLNVIRDGQKLSEEDIIQLGEKAGCYPPKNLPTFLIIQLLSWVELFDVQFIVSNLQVLFSSNFSFSSLFHKIHFILSIHFLSSIHPRMHFIKVNH